MVDLLHLLDKDKTISQIVDQLQNLSNRILVFKRIFKGEEDAAELAANTYANHICTKFF